MDENAERISLELIAGDEQAFDTVYKQYYRGLCAFASQYVTVPESVIYEKLYKKYLELAKLAETIN